MDRKKIVEKSRSIGFTENFDKESYIESLIKRRDELTVIIGEGLPYGSSIYKSPFQELHFISYYLSKEK